MIVHVMVRPNSDNPKVINFGGFRYLVYIHASLDSQDANIELLDLLSKYTGTPPNRMRIVDGLASKDKIIELY